MKSLAKARNYHGPLDKQDLDKIRRYIQNPRPTAQDWEDIAHMVINPTTMRAATVWQAVRRVDQTIPGACVPGATAKEKWPVIPSGFIVALGIKKSLAMA